MKVHILRTVLTPLTNHNIFITIYIPLTVLQINLAQYDQIVILLM